MSNPYYQAEEFGLTPLGEVELREPCYSFDILAVWYHAETKRFYWATDSGCSCPAPFEDYKDLESLNVGNKAECLAAVDSETAGDVYDGDAAMNLRERILAVTA